MIYFVKQHRGTPIRIGIATDIDVRIQKLQAGSSKKLLCLKIINTENDHLAKQRIYLFFNNSRLKKTGWFISTRNIQIFIRNLKNEGFYHISDIIYELSVAKESVNKFKTKINVDKIKQKMIFLKYNQSKLAKKIGLTRQSISFLFIRQQTSLFTAQKIATALECTSQEIIYG